MTGFIVGLISLAATIACVVVLIVRGGSDGTDYPSENGDGDE